MIIGSKFYYLDEVDSTNEYAKRILDKATEGTVVLADVQTAGKGRLDRYWYSPEGGIYLSVILFPDKPLLIPILAGVAICDTFYTNYNVLLGIKWPNDILLNEKKVSGVLVEIVEPAVIVGIGINLNITEFPEELKETASSIFIETKKRLDKMMVYNDLCREIEDNYQMLKDNKASEILQKWRNYTIMFGKTVKIETPEGIVKGRVIDIAGNGALVIMLPDGKIEKVLAGECIIVKECKAGIT
jgi:BirA family biotin operon repressor/biotin-[acetyl-CoA-carboxylase] ligase|uniref:biotin--[biotin carboxyl-carrier protein] ligase n=1 Tax=candidate division WOR-3 bacterium TaxID=2052148 RepID=A0A7V3RG09_UNCW3